MMAQQAALERYLPKRAKQLALHSTIADHLFCLPRSDPLRRSDAAHHLASSGRHIDLARLAADKSGPAVAHTFLELLAPHREDRLDLTALIASPGLTASEARELGFFLTCNVYRLARRSWAITSSIGILEQTVAALARRREVGDPLEVDEHDRALTVIENELFESLSRILRDAEAAAYIERALLRIERLVERHPASVDLIGILVDTLERAGHASFRVGQLNTALERLERGVATCRRLMVLDPQPEKRLQLASALAWLGVVHKERKESASALACFEEALSEHRVGEAVTSAVHPMFAGVHDETRMFILEYLLDLKTQHDDTKGALTCGAELVEARQRLWEKDPGDLSRLRKLAVARLFYGHAMAADPAGAELEFEKAAAALAAIVSRVPDDVTAVNNFCTAVAALDTTRIHLLKLSVSLAHGELLEKCILRADKMSDELRSRLTELPRHYVSTASELLGLRLFTATQLCVERFVWWTSRLRGERGRPSKEALTAALPDIGYYKVTVAQMAAALGCIEKQAGGAADSPPQPLRSVIVAGHDPDVGAAGNIMATPMSSEDDLRHAVEQAALSARAGATLNAQRWREAAAELGSQLGLPTRLTQDVSALRAYVGVPASGVIGDLQPADAAVVNETAPEVRECMIQHAEAPPRGGTGLPTRLTAEASRLNNAARDLRTSLAGASQTAVMEAFYTWVARAPDQLGSLLKAPSVAMAQIAICQLIAVAAEREHRPIEASRALELAVDTAMNLPDDESNAKDARLAGELMMPQLYRVSKVADRPLPLARLRAMFEFALKLAASLPEEADAAAVAGQLATELGQRTLDEAKDPDAALALFQHSITLLTQSNQRLRSPDIALDISTKFNRIGDLHFSRRDFDQAEYCYRQALAQRRRLLAEASSNPTRVAKTEYYIAGSLERLSQVEQKRGAVRAAAQTFAEAAKIRERLYTGGVPDPADAVAALWYARSRRPICS
jgi:tetratricopeptide (TPR) repeat protein